MLYTEQSVRDNLRNRDGKRVFFLGKEDRLTCAAREYLKREGIEILPAQAARPVRYRILGGGFSEEKPEHMTHLNGEYLVRKTHPRIAFRGMMDSLEGEILLCQQQIPVVKEELGEILALAREMVACDVLQRPLEEKKLCALTGEEIRKRSHFPQDYYGQPHFMPECTDDPQILLLNRLRAWVRMAELRAVDAFSDREGNLTREDLVRGLNRMSSMVYLLMIRLKSGKGRFR